MIVESEFPAFTDDHASSFDNALFAASARPSISAGETITQSPIIHFIFFFFT
jgi:hypothetical protein